MKAYPRILRIRMIGNFLAILGLVIIIKLAFILFDKFKPLQNVDIYQLDMHKTAIPTQWACDSCTDKPNAQWSYEEWSNLDIKDGKTSTMFPVDPDVRTKIIHWIDEKDGNVIELVLVDYQNPIIAEINFLLNDPKGWARKHNDNFEYTPENMVPSNWEGINKEANDEVVRCGNGNQEDCWGWFYQARYGQYYLFIHFYHEINYRGFEKIVKVITSQFAKNIR